VTSTALVPVAVSVDVLEAREIEQLPHCGACGQPTERLRRLGGVGRPLCVGCYQRARRAAEAAFEELRTVAIQATDALLYSFLVKGAKTRTIPLHPAVSEAIAATDHSGPHIFPGRVDGGHISPASIWNWVRAVSVEAGVGLVRPHWLRHTALATSNDATGDLRTVQHFAGHARSATTEGYTRATRARLRDAVRAIDY
jgi:integrase